MDSAKNDDDFLEWLENGNKKFYEKPRRHIAVQTDDRDLALLKQYEAECIKLRDVSFSLLSSDSFSNSLFSSVCLSAASLVDRASRLRPSRCASRGDGGRVHPETGKGTSQV